MNFLLIAAVVSEMTLLRCGPMNAEPVVDGAISETEIEHTSATYGLTSDKTALMATRGNVAFLGWTEKGVYCAVRSAVPPLPQRLGTNDAVTLTLQPPKGEPKDFRVLLGGAPRSDVRTISCAVGPEKGVQECGYRHVETEIFVPWSVFGAAAPADGERWGLQVALAYASKPEKATWHFNADAPGELGLFVPDRTKPVVGLQDFDPRESWRNSANCVFRTRYFNPTAKRLSVKCASVLHHGIGFSKLDANPETSAEVKHRKLDYALDATLEPGANLLRVPIVYNLWPGTVNILDNEFRCDGEVVYRRRTRWDVAKGVDFAPEEPMPRLYSGFYPTVGNRLRTGYTAWGVKDLVRAEIRVVDSKDKVCWSKEWKGRPNVNPAEFPPDVSLGELPEDAYRVILTSVNAAGRVYTDEKTFAVRKFKWQDRGLGTDRIVIPPFKPIKVEGWKSGEVERCCGGEGTISFLLTGYHCKGVLWDRVFADGENILAAPVTLKVNDQEFTVTGSRFLERSPDRVVREVTAALHHSTTPPRHLTLRVTQTYDYDGFCMATFRLEVAEPVEIKSIRVELPLRDDVVSLFSSSQRHDKRDGPAPNFAIPSGSGEIWTSRMPERRLSEHQPAYLHPYLWIGGPRRGLCWIAESCRDWSLDRERPAQRMIRGNGTLTLECDLVNKPVKWEKGVKEFRMGFQATPVKPVNERHYREAETMWDYACPSNATRFGRGSFATCSALINPMHTYPGRDLSLVRWGLKEAPRTLKASELKSKGDAYVAKHADWFRRSATSAESFAHSLTSWVRWSGGNYLFYLNPELNTCMWPEWEMYKAEWHCEAWPREDMIHEYLGRPGPSRNDKLLFDGYRALKLGYAGIYYDCFNTGGDLNYLTLTNGAFVARNYYHTPAASLTSVLWWRDLMKRTAVMCYLNGGTLYGEPLTELHITDGNVVPVTSWCSNALCTERGANGGDFQDRFPEGYTLAEICGGQSGAAPKIIVSARTGARERCVRELRSLVGYMCAYGIFNLTDQGLIRGEAWFDRAWNIPFDYGLGDPDRVDAFRYYDGRPQPFAHTGADVRLTTLVKKDGSGALLLLGNLGEEAEVAVKDEGGRRHVAYVDAETGKDVDPAHVKIDRHGYRMIYAK